MLRLFKNLSISSKIAAGSVVTLILTIAVALSAWFGVQTLFEKIESSQDLSNVLAKMNEASRAKSLYIAQPRGPAAQEVDKLLAEIRDSLSGNAAEQSDRGGKTTLSAINSFSSSFAALVSAQKNIRERDAEIAKARVDIRNVGDKLAMDAQAEEARLHQASKKQQQLIDRANSLAFEIGDLVEYALRSLVSLSELSVNASDAALDHLKIVRRISGKIFDSSVSPEVDAAAVELQQQTEKTTALITRMKQEGLQNRAVATRSISETIDRAKAVQQQFFAFIEKNNAEKAKTDAQAMKARSKSSLGAKFARQAMEAASEIGEYRAAPSSESQNAIENRIAALKALNNAVKAMTGNDATSTIEELNDAFAGLVVSQNALTQAVQLTGENEVLASRTLNDLVAQNKTEADRIASQVVTMILAATLISIAFAALLTYGLWFLISRPLRTITDTTLRVAEGQDDVEIEADGRKDEIGQLTSAISIFRNNLIENKRLEEQQRRAQIAQTERQQKIDSLVATFQNEIRDVLKSVGENVDELQTTATDMTKLAEDNASRSADVSEASQNASSNVDVVAAAAEELASSIDEISRQATEAMQTVEKASGTAITANEKISELAKAAQMIGEVISLISDIAEQTNLLALNATIEAARAGEAGNGFAVVAAEVKDLATQTSNATHRITEQIASIQKETGDAVKAIGTIAATMNDVNQYSTAIAAAVNEQGSATGEISHNVLQAAERTRSVAQTIGEVTTSSAQAKDAADQVFNASANMRERASTLQGRIDRFLLEVAAA